MARRPPCPGNPEDYVWIESKENPHWRRKRGTVNTATLNARYQKAADTTKLVSPAAKKVRNALAPYLKGITTGRLNNRICNAFRTSLNEKNDLLFAYLKGIEIQKDYPFEGLVVCAYKVSVSETKVCIEIPIEPGNIKRFNSLVTDYYFEAVLLYGDVKNERCLETEHVESPLYSIHSEVKTVCALELGLPETEDWCVLLKISSIEGNEMAVHTKHYRMKVVAAARSSTGNQ